jgi:aspartyl-tRNA(Asn)/glutamyl-tRNA(Gln) amidotransferase subunit C
MITKEQIQYIANLARLSLSEKETESFTHQIKDILEYMEQLNQIDTSNVEPTSFISQAIDAMRDDVESASLSYREILKNGPNVKNGFFAIPKVINQ